MSEEEQMRWAMEESMRANGHAHPKGLPPESLVSPISPQRKRELAAAAVPPPSRFGPTHIKTAAEELEEARRATPKARNTVLVKDEALRKPVNPTASPVMDLTEPFVPENQWTCEVCTCINPMQYLACDACAVERPQALAQPRAPARAPASQWERNGFGSTYSPMASLTSQVRQQESLGWNCGNCGAFMEHRWWTCSACGVMKAHS